MCTDEKLLYLINGVEVFFIQARLHDGFHSPIMNKRGVSVLVQSHFILESTELFSAISCWTRLLDKGNISALTTWSYTGERFADIGNVPYAVIPAFDRWDFRASWESPSRTWDVTFYVQNIADKIGIQEWAYQSVVWLTEHRQSGIQVRYRPDL